MSAPLLHRAVFTAWVATGLAYLAWRLVFTVADASWPFAAFFVLAEAWLFLTTASCYALVGVPDRPEYRPNPPIDEPLDILVATFREPLPLVRRTIEAALRVRGRKTVWVCDDGGRDELRALAAMLGANYLARPTNEHFKAGNLNHALAATRAPFVLVLDADHVVRADFWERLSGEFAVPQVAFVQTPQVYWNLDAFAIVTSRGRPWHDGLLFHHGIQRGAQARGAASFVGTGAILRRSALEAIGGFGVQSVTEDMLTSLRLHAAGFHSVYVDESLGLLLAAETPEAFAKQRRRWAEGAMQILAFENPLFVRGLTWAQRWVYLAHLSSFLSAWPSLFLLAAPGAFLLAGWNPVSADPALAAIVIALHVVADAGAHAILTRPHGRWLAAEAFRLLALADQLRATWRLFFPIGAAFAVTPKAGARRGAWSLAIGPGIVGIVNGASVIAAIRAAVVHAPDAPVRIAAGAFALWFVASATLAISWLARRPVTQDALAVHADPASFPADLYVGRDAARALADGSG